MGSKRVRAERWGFSRAGVADDLAAWPRVATPSGSSSSSWAARMDTYRGSFAERRSFARNSGTHTWTSTAAIMASAGHERDSRVLFSWGILRSAFHRRRGGRRTSCNRLQTTHARREPTADGSPSARFQNRAVGARKVRAAARCCSRHGRQHRSRQVVDIEVHRVGRRDSPWRERVASAARVWSQIHPIFAKPRANWKSRHAGGVCPRSWANQLSTAGALVLIG
jgi:hypothetical protein